MAKHYSIYLTEGKRIPKLTPEQGAEVKKALGDAIAKRPGVQLLAMEFDPNTGIGVATWEAPNAKVIEDIINELKIPYDAVVPVVPLEL